LKDLAVTHLCWYQRYKEYLTIESSSVGGANAFLGQIRMAFVQGWERMAMQIANTSAQLSEFAEFRRKQNIKEHELIK